MQIVWNALQIKGAREYQEDYFAVLNSQGGYFKGALSSKYGQTIPRHWTLLVLADGMGGMGHGDVASELVCNAYVGFVNENVDRIGDGHMLLWDALVHANLAVYDFVAANRSHDGMGCTLIVALVDTAEQKVFWLSVGDSLLYLLRNDELHQLNETHIADDGESLSSAVDGQHLHMVNKPNTALDILSGDTFLLASDGIETLAIEEVRQRLTILPGEASRDAKLSDHLWHLSKQLNYVMDGVTSADDQYQDNVTLLAASVS